LNIYKFDPFYEKTEGEWEDIKMEILGEENVFVLKNHDMQQQKEEI